MLRRTSRERRPRVDAGFTLIELLVTVAIMGFVVTGLVGIIMSYLKTSTDTQSRMTESLDLQFVTAYWQRDVSSLGVRTNVYDDDEDVHSFRLLRSVNLARCAGTGSPVVTLAWSEYDSTDSDAVPPMVKVTYVTRANGAARLDLVRIRCGSEPSEIVVARNLTAVPSVVCTGGGVSGCADTSDKVPTKIAMTLTISDPEGHGNTDLSETIAGERRQT